MSAPDGLLVIDKPAGWTSHDVVGRTRRLARTKKVGHAGTLDPMATGVLVLGIGRATRLLGHLSLTTKAYAATIRLGASTVTDDAEGDILEQRDASAVGDVALAAAMQALSGELVQVPSSVSAVKVDGVRSYARVRSGQSVVLAGRPVVVRRFVLESRRGDELDVQVECSSGTYVRALARDLGSALGVGGHLSALRRTRVGPFTLDKAHTLEAFTPHDPPTPSGFTDDDLVDAAVIGLDAAVTASFARWELSGEQALALSHGRRLAASGHLGVVGAFDPDGRCVALVEDRDGAARPSAVFRPATG